jgi:ankyrin repeat protein
MKAWARLEQNVHNIEQIAYSKGKSYSPSPARIVSTSDTINQLAQEEKSPFLSLPAELVIAIMDCLDPASRLSLTETCYTMQALSSHAQRRWWKFEQQYLPIAEQYNLARQDRKYDDSEKALNQLSVYYPNALNALLVASIDQEERKIVAQLVEQFFAYLPQQQIKQHINEVLASKPADTDWLAIFAPLAEVNLHLCLTILAMASPGFDPKNEGQRIIIIKRKIAYPFAELYPQLLGPLLFQPAAPITGSAATTYYRYRDIVDNLPIDNTQIKQFFLQFRFRQHQYNTLLHFAIAYGYIEIFTALVRDRHHIDLLNFHKQTVLLTVCSDYPNPNSSAFSASDHAKVIKLLLELGANPNAQDHSGNTALMLMSRSNNLEAIRLLLVYGAKVNLQDSIKSTALFAANRSETALLLLNHSAQINHQNSLGKTALIAASRFRSQQGYNLINTLLEQGAKVNISDKEGKTALMYASELGNVNVIRLLLAYDADPTLQDAKGQTALTYAKLKQHTEAVQILEAHMASKI